MEEIQRAGCKKVTTEDTRSLLKALASIEDEVRNIKILLLLFATKLVASNGSKVVTQKDLGKSLGLTDRQIRNLLNRKKRTKRRR